MLSERFIEFYVLLGFDAFLGFDRVSIVRFEKLRILKISTSSTVSEIVEISHILDHIQSRV